MSLSNAAVTLDYPDNISIATISTTTSIPVEQEGNPATTVAHPKSSSPQPQSQPSLLPSLLESPPSLLLHQKQQPILESEIPLPSPEHPDQQQEQPEREEQEDNQEQRGEKEEGEGERERERERGREGEREGEEEGEGESGQHANSLVKSSDDTAPVEVYKPYSSSVSFDLQGDPLLVDDVDVDKEEEGYDLTSIPKIRGRGREPAPGSKRVLKRVRVRKDTTSSKKRAKKHNLRASMGSAAIAERLAAERSERSGGKEVKRERKKERLAAVVEWKPIVEPVSKPRARPSGLRFMESCYSDTEKDEGQGSEQTGQKRKREDESLGDDNITLGRSTNKSESPEKRQHQSPCETETGTLQTPPYVAST